MICIEGYVLILKLKYDCKNFTWYLFNSRFFWTIIELFEKIKLGILFFLGLFYFLYTQLDERIHLKIFSFALFYSSIFFLFRKFLPLVNRYSYQLTRFSWISNQFLPSSISMKGKWQFYNLRFPILSFHLYLGYFIYIHTATGSTPKNLRR